MKRLVLTLIFLAAGCHTTVVHDSDIEPSGPIGQRGLDGYHVLANASTTIPGGDIGYLVTTNGQGGYRLVFTDTANSNAVFTGSLTTDVGFEPNSTSKFSGSEDVSFTSINRIDFSGVPGDSLEGVDFVSTTDPVYFDLLVDGSHQGFGIFFTGARTAVVQESVFDPVAFTSP